MSFLSAIAGSLIGTIIALWLITHQDLFPEGGFGGIKCPQPVACSDASKPCPSCSKKDVTTQEAIKKCKESDEFLSDSCCKTKDWTYIVGSLDNYDGFYRSKKDGCCMAGSSNDISTGCHFASAINCTYAKAQRAKLWVTGKGVCSKAHDDAEL